MRWSALVIALLAIAGCSGKPPAGDDATAPTVLDDSGQPILNGTLGNVTLLPITDTLFLSGATRLNATGLANLTVLATLSGPLPITLSWNATLNGTGNVTRAHLRLWIDLQNSALQPGVGGDPGCTAALTLYFVHNGTLAGQPGGCASAGNGRLDPGEYLLNFGAPLVARAVQPGDGILIQVAFGLSFPQGVGYVLGGGDRPSALSLVGLAEPVPSWAGAS